MNIAKSSPLILISFLIINSSHAQIKEDWIRLYNGPANRTDQAMSVVTDNTGNCYVTGFSNTSGSIYDIVTIKYNSVGDSLWVKRYDGPGLGDDKAFVIKVDLSANVYVTGYSLGSGTGFDYVTIKYNSSGVEQWVRRYNGPGNANDYATDMELDSFGNIYVTGYSAGTSSSEDYATLKYNSSGVLQWVRRYNGPANGIDHGRAIDVDSLGNVYVTGRSAGINTGVSDYATIKYNSIGDSVWVRRYNGPGNGADSANSISVGINGNIFITGNSFGISTGSSDFATIMYNAGGDSVWVRRYNGPPINNTDLGVKVRADKRGNTFVAGSSVGNGSGYDFAILKYNSLGVLQWTNRFSHSTSNTDDQVRSLVIDQWGDIYVTGYSNGHDFRTIKYNSTGDSLWNRTYNQNSDDIAFGIAIDSTRRVYVVGYSYTGFINSSVNYQTIQYSQSQALYLTANIQGFYNPISNKMARDTMRVYLRSSITPYTIVDSAKAFLDTNGKAVFDYFRVSNETPYYLQLKHRNSIETWSKFPVVFSSFTLYYDFTIAANKAYGDNQTLKGNKYCIYNGDVTQDGIIDAFDLGLVDNDALIGVGGYVKTDLSGDFFVDSIDLAIIDNNIFRYVTKVVP